MLLRVSRSSMAVRPVSITKPGCSSNSKRSATRLRRASRMRHALFVPPRLTRTANGAKATAGSTRLRIGRVSSFVTSHKDAGRGKKSVGIRGGQ
jgi:hypothetical protein